MFERFMKVSTVNGEQRWINLDRVTRVSMATDQAGEQILVFCFDGADRVTIHGADADSRALIKRTAASLDSFTDAPPTRRAA